MGKQIKNDLRHVTIEGNYTGGNNIVNYYTSQKEEEKVDKKNKTIFLSYNWHDEEIVDRIDQYLSKLSSIVVKRDIRDIGSWKSIREFMKSIRQQDYAVLIVSDSYLRSKNCMFEVTEIIKEPEYKDRVFPAIIEHGIYNSFIRVEYIKYWQQECDKLEAAIKRLDLENATELTADLKWYKSIAFSMGEFLSMIADKNNPDIQNIEIQIENAILKNR